MLRNAYRVGLTTGVVVAMVGVIAVGQAQAHSEDYGPFAAAFSATEGQSFSGTLTLSPKPAADCAGSWNQAGLPAGLSISGVPGQITGTPATSGSSSWTLNYNCNKPKGDVYNWSFNVSFNIAAQPMPPGPLPGPAPEPTPEPSPTPEPVPTPLEPGASNLEVNGVPTPVTIDPNGTDNGLDVTGDGWTMDLDGLNGAGQPLNLGPKGVLVLDAERDVRTTGTGFRANSPVYLYIDPPLETQTTSTRTSWVARTSLRLAEAIYVGTLTVDDQGNFAGNNTLPEGVEPGTHILQAIGQGPSGDRRVLSLGVLVRPWIVLDQGVRTAAGMHDRMQTTGDSGGIPEGALLAPSIKYVGQSSYKAGKAVINVRADGSFDWKRLVRKDKGLTAYVSYVDADSNQVFWARVR